MTTSSLDLFFQHHPALFAVAIVAPISLPAIIICVRILWRVWK